MTAGRAAVVALLAAAAVLIVLELGLGASSYGSEKLANPCHRIASPSRLEIRQG